MSDFPSPYGEYWQCHLEKLRNILETTKPAGLEFDCETAKKYGKKLINSTGFSKVKISNLIIFSKEKYCEKFKIFF